MPMTAHEIQTVCDNCGRLIKREPLDAATYYALVDKAEPAVGEPDEDRTLADEDDLIADEEGRLVEVFLRHEPVCSHCADRH